MQHLGSILQQVPPDQSHRFLVHHQDEDKGILPASTECPVQTLGGNECRQSRDPHSGHCLNISSLQAVRSFLTHIHTAGSNFTGQDCCRDLGRRDLEIQHGLMLRPRHGQQRMCSGYFFVYLDTYVHKHLSALYGATISPEIWALAPSVIST